jgi:predicted extracellular nuclease
LNPGRIEPESPAWNASRKPLAAEWKTPYGDKIFTVNVHFTSKGGSGSTQGNSRPPVNGGVGQRAQQVQHIAVSPYFFFLPFCCFLRWRSFKDFVKSIYDIDKKANIIVSGDFNEFVQTSSVYAPLKSLLVEVDEAAELSALDRYTYIFDQNHQQLDHMFVSNAIAKRKVEVEHIHVNNWSPSYEARISDHDPSVARVRVCDWNPLSPADKSLVVM